MPTYIPDNQRMARNTAMLYFRMALMMCIALYTSRVILQALGIEDYGIYNVVGGIVILFSFINDGMTVSTQRFLSFEMGKDNHERLHEVFVTSIHIHLLISLVIVFLAETVGLWFLLEKLVIPPDRLDAAFWVYQLSIVTAVINIMSFPYNAAIIAHERMSAFAYISVLDAILKLLIVYLLMAFDYNRLVLYAILFACEKLMIRMVYNVYCVRHFKECRYSWVHNKALFKEMVSFAGWSMWGNFAYVAILQGVNILLNLFFGPVVNAARAVAIQVQGAVSQFAKNFQMAINPQITKTYASGQMAEVHSLIFLSSKITFYLLLALCIPLIVETPNILRLWLEEVPDYTVPFVRLMLLTLVMELISDPLATTIAATGKIRRYEIINGSLILLTLPIAYVALRLGGSPWSVYLVQFVVAFMACGVRLYNVMSMIQMSIKEYLLMVVKPCLTVAILSALVPMVMKLALPSGLLFSLLTIIITVFTTVTACYLAGMNTEERALIKTFVTKKLRKRQR